MSVPGVTVNRLCASGAEAIVQAARAVGVGDQQLVIAGGVEGMSRSPYVVPKPDEAVPRTMEMVSTTIGWRLVNPNSPRTGRSRSARAPSRSLPSSGIGGEQDAWALRSHELAGEAWDKRLHDDYCSPSPTSRATIDPAPTVVMVPVFVQHDRVNGAVYSAPPVP